MSGRIKFALAAIAGICAPQLQAANLLEVYHQAIASDPGYLAADYVRQANAQRVALAESAFTPKVNLSGALDAQREDIGSLLSSPGSVPTIAMRA